MRPVSPYLIRPAYFLRGPAVVLLTPSANSFRLADLSMAAQPLPRDVLPVLLPGPWTQAQRWRLQELASVWGRALLLASTRHGLTPCPYPTPSPPSSPFPVLRQVLDQQGWAQATLVLPWTCAARYRAVRRRHLRAIGSPIQQGLFRALGDGQRTTTWWPAWLGPIAPHL